MHSYWTRPYYSNKLQTERNREIYIRRVYGGENLKTLAVAYGLSVERIRQICFKVGLQQKHLNRSCHKVVSRPLDLPEDAMTRNVTFSWTAEQNAEEMGIV